MRGARLSSLAELNFAAYSADNDYIEIGYFSESTMLDFVLVICSAFGGGLGGEPAVPMVVMNYQIPGEKVTAHFCIKRHEIFGAVFYEVCSDRPEAIAFAPPLYMRYPPMIWAVPNNTLFGRASMPHPYSGTIPSSKP
jgi:hypothetical protein